MKNKANRGDYLGSEAEFFAKTIDLKAVIEDYGYKYSRQSSSRMQPVYTRGDRVITVTLGSKTGMWIWCDLNRKTDHGTLKDFLMMEEQCDKKAAYDKMREIALSKYGVDYQMFKDGFAKLHSSGLHSAPSQNRRTQKDPRVDVFDYEFYEKENLGLAVKEFTFEKAQVFDFFLNRGITQATLDDPLFRGRFGNTQGAFGYVPKPDDEKIKGLQPSDFEFLHHILVPYWDWQGRVVGMEAKNRLTEEAFERLVEKEIEKGGAPRRVRRNPSKFYPESSKKHGAWVSNIPDKPLAICIFEQPANAMAYFQLQQDDPLVRRTIYVSTGGSITKGHYAILHKLIREYGIEIIIPAFDMELQGLKYALNTIQNLPFNDAHKQVYNVEFRTSAKHELEIDFILRKELLTIKPEDLLAALESIKSALATRFSFEGNFDMFPALTLRDVIGTFTIPFTPNNAGEIIRLGQVLLKTKANVFRVQFPPTAKDWNDELQGTNIQKISRSVLLWDTENRNKLYINANNELLFYQHYASFDHNIRETVGEVFPFAQKYFVKPAATIVRHRFLMEALETAQREYQSMVPVLKEEFVSNALRQGIVYVAVTHEFVHSGSAIAKWHADTGSYVGVDELTDAQKKVLNWMSHSIRSGKDPNKPEIALNYNEVHYRGELVGRISKAFTFEAASSFTFDKMDQGGLEQFGLLMRGFSTVREKWRTFREKYSEPVLYLSSENLVLMENKIPLFKFLPETGQLEVVADAGKILNRHFNPFFYKALQLFVENQGVFFNYIRLMRVDAVTGAIFYNTADHEIGRAIVDDGKTYYAVYDGIPESMKREMQLLSPFPQASPDLIKKHNIVLEPSGLNAKIKENSISRIPFAYLRFYDARRKKFNPLPDEKLKRLPSSFQELYTEAYLWHLKHVGSAIDGIGSGKERFFERDGVVYFNRIPVAKYDPEKDVLDTFAPPSRKFYQYLAIFERNLVKNPANRAYADFLLSGNQETEHQTNAATSEIERILDKIELSEDQRLQIVDKAFNIKDIGYIHEKKLIMDEEYMRYSDSFREALSFFSKNLGYALEWRNLEAEKSSVKANFSSIEVPERTQVFEHKLSTTPAGILQSVSIAPIFEGKVSIDNKGELLLHFLPGKEGQVAMPFGSDWDAVKTVQYWMSKQAEKPHTLVLASNPDQAILHHQYNLPESMYDRYMYLSVLNGTPRDVKILVEKMIATHGIKELRLVGESDFVVPFQGAFSSLKNVAVFPVPLITVEQSLSRFRKQISSYEASVRVQEIIEGISGHNFMNPTEGLVIFPMRSEASLSMAVLGAQLLISKDADALWFSRPIRHAAHIILVSNQEEALSYMQLNKEFVRNDAIISFQNSVTEAQVKYLVNSLKVPRFHGRIKVANTGRLSEQLLDHQFRLPFQIEKPLHETSFRLEWQTIKDSYQTIKKDILLSRRVDLSRPVGKSDAPVLVESLQIQGQKEQKVLR